MLFLEWFSIDHSDDEHVQNVIFVVSLGKHYQLMRQKQYHCACVCIYCMSVYVQEAKHNFSMYP